MAHNRQGRKLISDLQDKDQGRKPDYHKPYFWESLHSRRLRVVVAHSDIGNDEDTQDNLEAPINDTLSRQDNHHEEYGERYQHEELFLQMLDDLPQMEESRIPTFEAFSRSDRVPIDEFLVLQDMMY